MAWYNIINLSYFNYILKGTGPQTNQSQPIGGCGPGVLGGIPCPPQTTPSAGCGSMGMGTPCPPVPQAMPAVSPTCGVGSMGGTPCITIDSGCVQIGSQPSGGAPCPAPTQGMAPGGCPDMGTGAMPGSTCVIQGKLTVGCPNVTTGGNPCLPPGNITGGNIIPGTAGPLGPNGITNGSANAKAPGSGPNARLGLLPSAKSVPSKTLLTVDVKFIVKECFQPLAYLNQIMQSGHRVRTGY